MCQESTFTNPILQSDKFTELGLDLEIEALSSGSSDKSASDVEDTDCSALCSLIDTATENADNCISGSIFF
uniref:Uncharacterized protein n=1 Tax=Amphimedon queenslandica TaxID=400682 RepID=A0A1X7UWG1_AMPQE